MTDAIDLPRPLQSWRQWLGWFDPALAPQVGELVRRLSDLVGNATSSGRGGQPEPDGLGDLRSRGPYERLLGSEWLLADELPDEFMRRAAASEHLFLAPRLRAAQVERSVVAIFDCGPRALGSARAAHLAAWILLARRADEQGGTLRWGVLQAPGPLHAGDAPARLGDLMRARRLDAGEASHVERWRAALQAQADAGDREIWWIGAPGPALPDGTRRGERVLALQATLAGDALDARVAGAGAQRHAALPLPPVVDITRLLRADFRTTVRETPLPANRTQRANRLSLTQGLIMSTPPGRVGAAELGHPAMLVFSIPHPGQTKLSKPRRQMWSMSRAVLALGLQGRNAIALTAANDELQFWQMAGFGDMPRPTRETFQASASTGRALQLLLVSDRKSQLACVIDAGGQLVGWRAPSDPRQWSGKPDDRAATVIDRQVRLMAPLGPASLAYAMVWGDGIWLRQVDASGQASAMRRRLCPAPAQLQDMAAVVMGYGTSMAQVSCLGLAHRVDTGTVWQLFTITQAGRAIDDVDGATSTEIRIGEGERGLGLCNGRGASPPALVVLSGDKRRLRLATPQSQATLYESASVIERCSVCQVSGRVAVLTRDRQLVVLDPATLQVLLIVTDNTGAADGDA